MCGIYGSVGFAPDQSRIDIVVHRGPDGQGWEVYDSPAGPVALGHRRLAIIDTSDDGLQPMTCPEDRHVLVFNGEIYNYLELRAELQSKGEVFATKTDSEVLLRAYAVWGPDFLSRLRGMFAFLIWDRRDNTLFAARDRFGIKPLYYVNGGAKFAFGSEIKQLLGLGSASGRMNIARVADYLSYNMSDHTDETMFGGVRQLRAGEYALLTTSPDGSGELSIRQYYGPRDEQLDIGRQEAAEKFRDLLTGGVRLHLRSDVPVGSCLSGGLDSSSIVGLMASQLAETGQNCRVQTVSACYDEQSVDEKTYIDAVVAKTAAEPHYVWPKAEAVFDRAADITWHQDEPFGSTSIFAQWCVFDEARRAGIKVMLDGQGADEQLAGYVTALPVHLASLCSRGRLGAMWRVMSARQELSGTPIGSQLRELLPQILPHGWLAPLHGRRRAMTQHDWMGDGALSRHSDGRTALQTAIDSRGLSPVRDLASLCTVMVFASNLQMLLHWEDRNSMAHSIEARVPFLDHPVVEFALALGNNHKIVDGVTKTVLRDAMAGVLPDSVANRHDKLGFATPEQSWFCGPLQDLARQGIDETLERYPELLNAAGVRKRADDMLEGRTPIDFWLWRVVNLGIWGARFNVTH